MIHHLQTTLERLESILDAAIVAMTQKIALDDAAVASAKGRALLALTRLSGDLSPDALPDEVKQRIKRVRDKLTCEHRMMERRLDASQLVVRLIGDAVIAQDWDGTYGPVPTQCHTAVLTNAVPTNAVPTNAVPTNAVPTNAVPTNDVPTNVRPNPKDAFNSTISTKERAGR